MEHIYVVNKSLKSIYFCSDTPTKGSRQFIGTVHAFPHCTPCCCKHRWRRRARTLTRTHLLLTYQPVSLDLVG